MNPSIIIRIMFVTFLCLALLLLINTNAFTRGYEGCMYGQITLKNGNSYRGVIRWGNEEAFWNDMFNSNKAETIFDLYLSQDDLNSLENDRLETGRGLSSSGRNWKNRQRSTIHQFKCRFGDIEQMKLSPGNSVLLTFKNGEEIKVAGGSNDIGTTIRIIDKEVGEFELKWSQIDLIEFMPAPKNLREKFGEPLFGEVETTTGRFKGYIQWDQEECLDTDKLDGIHNDGKISIRFEKIESIEKYQRGVLVSLTSGQEMYLYNSNDVNEGNRGIVIKDSPYGRVTVPWREFSKVVFLDAAGNSGPAYDDFTGPNALSGVVITEAGKHYSGPIIFDLDEALDLEILDGRDGDIEYAIAFRDIKKITPFGASSAVVQLVNGKELELEGTQDVNSANNGVLVWISDDRIKYVPWNEVRYINFY